MGNLRFSAFLTFGKYEFPRTFLILGEFHKRKSAGKFKCPEFYGEYRQFIHFLYFNQTQKLYFFEIASEVWNL